MSTSSHICSVLILLLTGLIASPVCAAFHSGGVGSCQGCHVGGHASADGFPLVNASGAPLLRAADASSVCLTCHAGNGGPSSPSVFSFDGSALTPGGDFYWLTRTFSWNGGSSPAASHGHNVVARDFNLSADPLRTYSPGGNYPAAQLSCISCHDPHGRSGGTRRGNLPLSVSGSYGALPPAGSESGNYRLLGDQNYSVNGFSFSNPAPVARQNPILPFAESDASHVDYGSGISAWCGNCHADIVNQRHRSATSSFRHSTARSLGNRYVSSYNSYVNSADLGGNVATAYLQFVPFARGSSDAQQLDPTSTQGMDSSSRLNCLTCHRAHASAFVSAGRWDFSAAQLVDSHPAIGDSGASAADVTNSYYGRDIAAEFGAGQGPFCEKCHSDNSDMGM